MGICYVNDTLIHIHSILCFASAMVPLDELEDFDLKTYEALSLAFPLLPLTSEVHQEVKNEFLI